MLFSNYSACLRSVNQCIKSKTNELKSPERQGVCSCIETQSLIGQPVSALVTQWEAEAPP